MSSIAVICGLDEVGRGALAGPLVAVGMVLPQGFTHPLLRDSKLLSARQREQMAALLMERALIWKDLWIDHLEVDRLGVHRANILIFERLIDEIKADLYKVDGNLKLNTTKSYQSIIHGESAHPAIAGASIVAKIIRDRHMSELHEQATVYGWDRNKGYGSAEHLDAIRAFGLHAEHRRSFRLPTKSEVVQDGG
jgi:ribonuclease HII